MSKARRGTRWLGVATVAVLAVVAVACGDDDDDGAASVTTAGTAAATSTTAGSVTSTTAAGGSTTAAAPAEDFVVPTDLEDVVVVAGSGGGLGEAYRAAFATFTDKTGVDIQWIDGLATDHLGRLSAQKNNPEVDLFQGELVSHYAGAGQGLWQPLDPERVPNVEFLPDEAKLDDLTAVLPVLDAVAFEYNTDMVDADGVPTTLQGLFENEELKGKIALPHIDNGYMRAYLAVLNDQLGGSPEDPTPALEYLNEHKDWILEYPRTPAQMSDLFTTGQIAFAVNGFSRIQELKGTGFPVELATPDALPITPLSWSFVADAPHPNAAQALVDWLASAEGQALVAGSTKYSPVRPGVEVPADAAASTMSPEQLELLTPWDYQTVQESLDTWRLKWAELIGAE